MELKNGQSAKDGKIFDVAAAVAERIKELEESHEEFMRRDAELNRMIDEAWKKAVQVKSEIPFSPKSPRCRGVQEGFIKVSEV